MAIPITKESRTLQELMMAAAYRARGKYPARKEGIGSYRYMDDPFVVAVVVTYSEQYRRYTATVHVIPVEAHYRRTGYQQVIFGELGETLANEWIPFA
jgi:hypothetical protein